MENGVTKTTNTRVQASNSDDAAFKVQSKTQSIPQAEVKTTSKPPKKAITVFLIISTMLLSLGLVIGGTYSLYISIGFSFLRGSALGGLNTSSLYTYSNSGYGNGAGSMVGLIIISIIMLGLGVGMAVIFFKQLPLYRQIKLVSKMPNVKYKDFTKEARKGIIVTSIIAYIVCIAFCIFAIVVASRQPISASYKWVVLLAFAVVLGLAISSMVLMFVKLGQLSKIKKQLLKENPNNLDEQLSASELIAAAQALEIGENNANTASTAQQDKPNDESSKQEAKPADKAESADDENVQKLKNIQTELLSQTSALLIASIANNSAINGEAGKVSHGDSSSNAKQYAGGLNVDNSMFETGVFELSDALQKLREIHVSGLIDANEYTLIRQKWINAMLKQPLFDGTKNAKGKKKGASVGSNSLAQSYAAAAQEVVVSPTSDQTSST